MSCCFNCYMFDFDKKFCSLTGYPFQSILNCSAYQRYILDPDDDYLVIDDSNNDIINRTK